MSDEPDFLTVEEVLWLHAEGLARYGGGDGIRSPEALDAAVAMPKATFDGLFVHDDLYAMAAAYAFHISQNQPFIDGNKRAGLAAALVFLDLNGIDVVDPNGELYDAMIGFAERRTDKADLTELLRRLGTQAGPA